MKKIYDNLNIRIPIANPNIGEEEARAVYEVVRSGWINEGEKVREFEDRVKDLVGTEYAVAFFNGTVALHSILLAYGIGKGDEVIVPSMTFISTATSVLHANATPIFSDIDPETFNIDPNDIEKRITPRTKAIMPVHYGGQSADMDEIIEIAKRHNLIVIEDAAEAIGARYKDRMVGNLGDAAMFSFTPTKNITTAEGGVVTTNDKIVAKKLRLLKNHGMEAPYHHVMVGYNYRMTEMQGAMGVEQLKKLGKILEKKYNIAQRYERGLSNIKGIIVPKTKQNRNHTYQMYTIRIVEEDCKIGRDELAERLAKKGIQTKVYFPPVHLQPIFKNSRHQIDKLPVTEKISKEILSLPCHSRLTEDELDYICSCIESLMR